MNEKIKAFAEQAGSTHKQSLVVYQFFPDELEKFAELIVKECAEFVSNDRQNDEYGVFVANRIKEHFGVE